MTTSHALSRIGSTFLCAYNLSTLYIQRTQRLVMKLPWQRLKREVAMMNNHRGLPLLDCWIYINTHNSMIDCVSEL